MRIESPVILTEYLAVNVTASGTVSVAAWDNLFFATAFDIPDAINKYFAVNDTVKSCLLNSDYVITMYIIAQEDVNVTITPIAPFETTAIMSLNFSQTYDFEPNKKQYQAIHGAISSFDLQHIFFDAP